MSDPLSLVRQATMTGTAVNYVDGNYIFGRYKLHESTKTCFKRTLGKSADYYYTLRDVIFFLENADLRVSEYRIKAVGQRITAVVEQDKQDLKNYLTGVIDSCTQIDLSVVSAAVAQQKTEEAKIELLELSNTAPQISMEQMQEQRQKHAALLDLSIQKSSATVSLNILQPTSGEMEVGDGATGLSVDRIEELKLLRRTQKRKAVTVEGGADAFDVAFLKADKKILSNLRTDEQPSFTRKSVLCKAAMDFGFALKLFNDHVLRPPDSKHHDSKSSMSATSSSSQKHNVFGNNTQAPRFIGCPILVVPSAVSSLITMYNAVDFLQHGKFVSGEEKKKEGAERIYSAKVKRILPSGQVVEYKIVDNPSKFKPEEWERVAAVFCTGQAWQFKDWKWSNPTELFSNVLGAHVCFDDRVLNPTVQSWNCKLLKISQFKRHGDDGAVNTFWGCLDDYLKLNKPFLIPKAVTQNR